MIDRETAVFLNRVAKLDLEFDEKGDQVDMCKAMEDNNRKREVTGAIRMLRADGASDETIITKVTNLFNVTKEYVFALLAPTPVVKGTAAVKIYKEANQKRSQASKDGAEKLKIKFSKKLK